jgi:hypothetical protein
MQTSPGQRLLPIGLLGALFSSVRLAKSAALIFHLLAPARTDLLGELGRLPTASRRHSPESFRGAASSDAPGGLPTKVRCTRARRCPAGTKRRKGQATVHLMAVISRYCASRKHCRKKLFTFARPAEFPLFKNCEQVSGRSDIPLGLCGASLLLQRSSAA